MLPTAYFCRYFRELFTPEVYRLGALLGGFISWRPVHVLELVVEIESCTDAPSGEKMAHVQREDADCREEFLVYRRERCLSCLRKLPNRNERGRGRVGGGHLNRFCLSF